MAKDRAGEEFLPIEVTHEGARLAYQRVDYVAVVDVGLLPVGAWIGGHGLAVVVETHLGFADARLHHRPDQAGGQRIGAVLHPGRAVTGNPYDELLGLRETSGRQRPQPGRLLGDLGGAQGVDAGAHLRDEGGIGADIGEVATAAQQQVLFEPAFEMALQRLDIAVLVGALDRDGARLDVQVRAQGEVLGVKAAFALAALELVGGPWSSGRSAPPPSPRPAARTPPAGPA